MVLPAKNTKVKATYISSAICKQRFSFDSEQKADSIHKIPQHNDISIQ